MMCCWLGLQQSVSSELSQFVEDETSHDQCVANAVSNAIHSCSIRGVPTRAWLHLLTSFGHLIIRNPICVKYWNSKIVIKMAEAKKEESAFTEFMSQVGPKFTLSYQLFSKKVTAACFYYRHGSCTGLFLHALPEATPHHTLPEAIYSPPHFPWGYSHHTLLSQPPHLLYHTHTSPGKADRKAWFCVDECPADQPSA